MKIVISAKPPGRHFERCARNPEASMLDAYVTCSGLSSGIPRAAATRANDNRRGISAQNFHPGWRVLRTRGGLSAIPGGVR
jgi:hypothetical protein